MPNNNTNGGQETVNQSSAFKALENLRMRLLDLTARNRLINFKHTKRGSLRIIDELPNQLMESLLSDTEMRFLAIPEPTEQQLIHGGYLEYDAESQQLIRLRKDPAADEWARYLGFATDYEVPVSASGDDSDKHTDTSIQTLLYPYEMEAWLKSLYQTAESAIQEMGANILYLAFGFLEWYDTNNNDNARIAPLFLVPVRLHKGRLNPETRTYEYTLTYSGEDIIPNLSLREKLRADFAMALPELDENTIPEDYFAQVQELIDESQPRWRVRRYISLALLNFSKLLMYLDLDPARWPEDASIIEHPVVSRFLADYDPDSDTREDIDDNHGFGEEYLIDEMDKIHASYPLIDDADSSQHSALIDAVDGKNLVIEGPPGTGKSQTITNLIAAAMSQGKRVLFVAEKLAALEVVRSRLDTAGLGEFCLELHSHKSQKRKVLDEVEERLKKHGNYRKPKDIEIDIARYDEIKTALKSHAIKINQTWKNTGKTLHEIFMAATRYRNILDINPELIHPVGYDGNTYDAAAKASNEDQVEAYRKMYQAVAAQLEESSDLRDHPWCGVRNGDLQLFDLDYVKSMLGTWQETLQALVTQRNRITDEIGLTTYEIGESVISLGEFLAELECLPILKGNEILNRLSVLRGEVLVKTQNYLKLFLDIQERYETLSRQTGSEFLQDLSQVDELVSGSEQLQNLIGYNVELGRLVEAINRLNAVQEQLELLQEPLLGLRVALGESIANCLSISETGLSEFRNVIKLISSLHPSYWKLRDPLFDNDELDELLPEFRNEVEELQRLYVTLQNIFTLEALPDKGEVLQLQNTLASGGFFKWLNSDWRSARKQVLGYAASMQNKLPELMSSLPTLAEYVGKRRKFDENMRYREALGQLLQGLETDITALESLRSWYKQVRHHYGVGFGQKVTVGDAIIELSPDIGKAVRSLSDRGVQLKLADLLDDISNLKEVFVPVSELHNSDTVLFGEGSVISRLLVDVNNAIRSCGTLVEDETLTMAELADRIEQISILKRKVNTWEKADFDQKLFQGRLRLKAGVGVDNSTGIASLQNTLALAFCLDGQLSDPRLLEYIYQHLESTTFERLAEHARELRSAITRQEKAYDAFNELVKLDLSSWTAICGKNIEELIARNQLALDNGITLQNWLDYVRVREQVEALGLNKLVSNIENNKIAIELVEDAYKASVYDVLAREILREAPELGRFSGRSQETMQEKFREYDEKLKTLQCELVAWKIDQTNIPPGHVSVKVGDLTERALLERECSKKKRHIPIRQLLQRAGDALVALKPCFMMGPMSVAQYLAPGQLEFDLVVMDEASQIKPQDALGAVARGGQLVVVGDPKQLPPTSFFDRIVDDSGDEDATAISVSESILDATLPMFPVRRLRWHYRSQHQSLIAFSNHSFYEDNLVLFPSPHKETENYGIQYSRIPRGHFVNNRNIEEAKIISESVRDHFRQHPEESLGVVAMNAEQRLQIERAIETLAKDDTLFQEYLDQDSLQHKSLFVKNLENVQGDERDVIFISMTYGPPEPGGHVYQRFGPINSEVGWRRLNVLFTRSKKRMHIFSSIRPDDIVIGNTSKRGVRALRDFLSFCETGILHKTIQETGRAPDSDFEIDVITALRDAGFECIPQVGIAGFFIDVAVVDPGNPGRYLMGIECDGATYHSAKSVRDRDRLRQTILERLGWNIRRIWSTDWFKNPRGELKPLIQELHELKTAEVPIEEVIESEVDEIGDVTEVVDSEAAQVDLFAFEESSLKDKLIHFEEEVIRKELPETPDSKRLLRPAMLEALLEYTPTSKVEFLELIPSYIRQGTDPAEGKYLDRVFDIINASLNVPEMNWDQ